MIHFKDTSEIFSHPVDGIVDQCEENLLRVKALGSIWNAKLYSSCPNLHLIVGQVVSVIGRIGIQLIITTQDCQF